MTRRVQPECGNGKRMRATNHTTYALHADDDAFWHRGKRSARKAYKSDGSAESGNDERTQNISARKKQHAKQKIGGHYNENAAETLDVVDYSKTQSKKQPKKSYTNEKYSERTESRYARAKRRRYAVSSDDSDTTTLTVTETSEATTSSSSNIKRIGRHTVCSKYRSYDDIVCHAERVNDTKYKRYVSDECVPPERLVGVQEYATKQSSSNGATSRSANEMLNFVNNLFKQLVQTQSATAVNKTSTVGGHNVDGTQRMPNMFDNTINQSVAPPKNTRQFAVTEANGRQHAGAQLVNPAISQNPTVEVLTKNYATEARNANNQGAHNEVMSQRYEECDAIDDAAKPLAMTAEIKNYGNNIQPQKYAFQNYLPKTQAEYAATSSAHGVNAFVPAPQQQQPHAPQAMAHSVNASAPTPQQQQPPRALQATARTYVATNFTPTVQPVQFAPANLITQPRARVYVPHNYTNYTQVQGNIMPHTSAPPALQFNKTESYEQQQSFVLPSTQSVEYVNRFRNERQEFVLSRAPIMPQVVSNTTNENLVEVTYITPRPTEVNIVSEDRDISDLNTPKTANARQTRSQSSNIFRTTSASIMHYPTSFIDMGSETRLKLSHLIENTKGRVTSLRATDAQPSNLIDKVDVRGSKEHKISDVRHAEAQTYNLNEPAEGIGSSYSDTHLYSGKISRTHIRAQAVDRILFPMLEYRLNENDRSNGASARNSQNITNKRESMDRAGSNRQEEAKSKRKKDSSKGRNADRHEESNGREDTSSSCNSDYIRECLRKRCSKKKSKQDGRYRTHTKKRKHYRSKDSDDSDSDSDESSDDYAERSSRNNRRKGKRRKHYEPYTPSGSESDDEMGDSFSKTSCKQVKKCCGRIVAICRMARDTAGTQTDECCDCRKNMPKTESQSQCSCKLECCESKKKMQKTESQSQCSCKLECCDSKKKMLKSATQSQCSCTLDCCESKKKTLKSATQSQCSCKLGCCDCRKKTLQKASSSQCSCKLEKDMQRKICESLANADQNAMRKLEQLSKEKKKCKVYTCGIVGENGAPLVQDDMIIIKFEDEEDARAQQKCVESAKRCKSDCNCKVTESESEIIKALIRKKRVYEKIQKACSLTSVKSVGCTCADEAEFMEDLLRQQRCERSMQNNDDSCICDIDDRAKEIATEVMKGLIRNHIRIMCAAELVNAAKQAASSCSESCAECLCDMESEESIDQGQECLCEQPETPKIVRMRKRDASASNESCAECLCGSESETQKVKKKKYIDVGATNSKIRAGDCTCDPNKNKHILQRSARIERKPLISTRNARAFEKQNNGGSERNKRTEANACADDCACSIDKNEFRSMKSMPSSSSRASAKESDMISARSVCCTCNDMQTESGIAKVKPERTQKRLEIQITTSSELRAPRGARENEISARTSNCTCEPHRDSESAQRIAKRTQRLQHNESSEMSVRAGDCTCKPGKQSAPQGASTLNMRASVVNRNRSAHEDRTTTKRMPSKIPAPKPRNFSSNERKNCRPDCACKDTRFKGNLSENISDYEEHTIARKPWPSSSKTTKNASAERSNKEMLKNFKPDCACKQTARQREFNDSVENVDERILARRRSEDEQSSEDDEFLSECSAHKSIQKLIIGIKANKETRASCTLIAYPQSIKPPQRYKALADAEQSASSITRNKQRAALCTELALNELMPQHSLRTLLTKLSSPNGKLFCTKNFEYSVPDGVNTFSVDQNKVLSLKTGANGKIKPTMIMSQAIRVTGKTPNSTQDGAAAEPLQYYKNKVLKLSNSAPSFVLTSGDANSSRRRAGHARPIKEDAEVETSGAKRKLKKSLIPLPTRRLRGRHSFITILTQSESAETRANTRPFINQTSDSNYHIMRLWPEQDTAVPKQQCQQQQELKRAIPTLHDDQVDDKSKKYDKIAAAMSTESQSQSNIELVGEKRDSAGGVKLTNSSSNSRTSQCHNKCKRKLSNAAGERVALKMVHMLGGSNESQLYTKRSSESNKSQLYQQPERNYRNTQHKVSSRKPTTKHNAQTPIMYSSHSIDCVERQNSATMLATNSNKKRRVTRFSLSNPEKHSDSEVECISLDYMDNKSEDEYEMELERKRKLWSEGTVREAVEEEERESERTRHWQRTTLTGASLERAINYPTSVWNEERKQLNLKRNGGGIFAPI